MPARIWGGRAQCRLAAALMQRSALSPQATGIAIFVLAIFTMSIMDVIAKAASQRVDVVQVLWARYAGQTLIVFLIVLPRLRSALRTAYPLLQLARSLLLLTATTCFFFAISRLPKDLLRPISRLLRGEDVCGANLYPLASAPLDVIK